MMLLTSILLFMLNAATIQGQEKAIIFPLPQQMEKTGKWDKGSKKFLDNGGKGGFSGQNAYCYQADPVDCSSDMTNNPIRFYAFEWVNKRFGKKMNR